MIKEIMLSLSFIGVIRVNFGSRPVPVAKAFQEKGLHAQEVHSISLIALIGNPARFVNKVVLVVGVGDISAEGNWLYLTKEHRSHSIKRNGLSLDFSNINKNDLSKFKKFNGKYVDVRGIFKRKEKGRSMFSGSILVDLYDLEER